jgi:ketosteroid isomerase-like protein
VKTFIIVMVSITALAALICAGSPAARADDQQEITDLEHKLAITTNLDEAMKYWAGGDKVVLFDVMTPREFTGNKAIHDHWAEWSRLKDVKINFLELKVISDGNIALALSVPHLTGKNANGAPVDIAFRQTDVWRKTNGQWKLIHEHASFPINMRTGKADSASKM